MITRGTRGDGTSFTVEHTGSEAHEAGQIMRKLMRPEPDRMTALVVDFRAMNMAPRAEIPKANAAQVSQAAPPVAAKPEERKPLEPGQGAVSEGTTLPKERDPHRKAYPDQKSKHGKMIVPVERTVELIEAGYNTTELANELGVSSRTLKLSLEEQGMPLDKLREKYPVKVTSV